MICININNFVLISQLEKDHSMIETGRLKNVGIFFKTILSFVLSRKIKDNIDTFSEFFFHNFNNSIFDATFLSVLKNADVIPVFKNKDQNNAEDYCPVSILSNLWKIYERCLYDQMHKYFNHILSQWQCGFRKGFITQHCPFVMTENCGENAWTKGV